MSIIKKSFFLIPAVMISAIALVSILAWSALRPLNQKTGFTRDFIATELQLINVVEKPKDILDFAGKTEHHIYFKTNAPDKVFMTNMEFKNSKYFSLKIPTTKKISGFSCIVDSPRIYIFAGNVPLIVKTESQGSFDTYKFPESLFTRVALLSDNSFVFRMFDNLDQVFAKGNPAIHELKKEKSISEKNNDAGISTDGGLYYDKASNQIIYTFFFKNEILCLDTNLNLIRKIKTIDVNTTSIVKAGEVSSKNSIITSLSPKRLINAVGCVNNGFVFNNSNIKADNESSEKFRHNSVIDVYHTRNGLFEGSFYIPFYKGEKAKKFTVIDNSVMVLYKSYLVSYRLPLEVVGRIDK